MNLASQTVQYQSDQNSHQGYLAWDQDIDGPRPGIIVIHEWWGLNDYIRERANQLAGNGFCALAIDMYGDGVIAADPGSAGELMQGVLSDMESGTRRLQAGYDTLLSQPFVDPARTAAIGYCFGGAMALHMARTGMPLKAAVSFHGALGAMYQAAPGSVNARVLVCHGGDDAMVSMDDVAAFQQEMSAASVDHEVIIHPGAMHGFSSREADENGRKYGIPVGYNEKADKDSWAAMIKLFNEVF